MTGPVTRKLRADNSALGRNHTPPRDMQPGRKRAYALQCIYIRRTTKGYPAKAPGDHFDRWLVWYREWLDTCAWYMENL